MRSPVKIIYRKAEAKIYGKSAARLFYQLCYCAAGKCRVWSFSTYSEVKTDPGIEVREIANETQTIASTDSHAITALSIRDALEAFNCGTGRRFFRAMERAFAFVV